MDWGGNMAKRNLPDSPDYYTIAYEGLKGVDFSCDITEVSRQRTPTGLNMISDDGGNPVKRRGWRKIVNFNTVESIKKVKKMLALQESSHKTPSIYILCTREPSSEEEGTSTISELWVYNSDGFTDKGVYTYMLYEGYATDMFVFDNKIYLMDKTFMQSRNSTGEAAMHIGYVPEVSISRNPDGTGGVSLEGVNILNSKRIFSFLGNNTDKEYSLVPNELTENNLYKYIDADSVQVEVMNSDGKFVTLEKGVDYELGTTKTMEGLTPRKMLSTYSVCEPKVIFTEVHAPIVTGQDNVRITFAPFDMTEIYFEGSYTHKGCYNEAREDLLTTSCTKKYGYSATDRIFAVGGVNKNRIYYSAVNDPTYWPDNNYFVVGEEGNDVIGLHTYSSYLVAIKGDTNVETTVYFIYGSTLNDTTYFAVKPAMGGEGAIAAKSFATLGSDPLFLTRNGVFAITNVYATEENVLRNRSYFLDKKLIQEKNLENACAVVWKRYYILCVNDHCYVLDGRKKATDSKNNTDYLYEGYYWENIPASCFLVVENELWFGTNDGNLCKFNSDINDGTAYSDGGTAKPASFALGRGDIIDGGVAIPCKWSTPLDSDGKPQYFKNLNKKGSLITLQPHARTSVSVTLSADGERDYPLGTFYADIFNWEDINFSRFAFSSNETAQDKFFNKKVRKYRRLQITAENNEINEPFGILQIVKTYTIGNFSKNRG